MLVRQKYGTREDFLVKMNPSVQKLAWDNRERAHFGDAPTLTIMRHTYGEGFPASWLMPQILDLVVYSNSRGTLDEHQMECLADAIVSEFYYLKASELMLFFYGLKLGKYGHFYGVVDPMKITEALAEFAKECDEVRADREREINRKERDEHDKTAMSPAEYCRMKGYPEGTSIVDIVMQEMNNEKKKG